MALIPQEVIEEVLARADILRTVQDYVSLKKSGSSFKGLCPFHDENTPSFYVTPPKGIFKCFGCGVGGNVISFLMEIERCSFPEAVRQLAERNGVEIPEPDPEAARRARQRRKGKKLYLKVMEQAREFFEQNLWSEAGRAARQYLVEREIDEKTARNFGLGYAPEGWQNLLDHLAKHSLSPRLVERAGLAMARDGGNGHYDRFRHRIVFPVVDIWENTLAFGGRTIAANDDAPKYINSPETKFYTKGAQLYGLHAAKKSIQKAGYALLVEGNFDVICLHAKGLETAVAPMGTALTREQAKLLERYCDRVVIAFDGDRAGEEATVRCIKAFSATKIEPLVIRFDELEDPDTFVRRRGAPALAEKVENAQPLVSWALDRVLKPAEGDQIDRKINALQEIAELLGDVGNPLVWEHYAQEVSRRLAIAPELLKDYLRRPDQLASQARQAVLQAARPMEIDAAEYGVLMALLDHPEWLAKFLDEELENILSTRELADFLQVMQQHYLQHNQINAPVLLEKIEHPAFRRTVAKALADENYAPGAARRFYQDCIRSLKKDWATRTLEDLTRQIEQIDFYNQRTQFEDLTRQKEQIARFKASLDLEQSS
jgi:DNA primase